MAMTITEQVAANLGRPLSDAESAQVTLWEGWVRADITGYAQRIGWADPLDPAAVDRVVVEAITLRLRNPNAETSYEVAVDDARTVRRRAESSGQLTYLPEWWGWLGLPAPGSNDGGAFTVTPTFAPDFDWPDWWTTTDRRQW